jgi:hypothetical protein
MTGTKLFAMALDLLNLRNSDGSTPENIADMKLRAVNIINICLAECAPLNRLLCKEDAGKEIQSLDETVCCAPYIFSAVLPFGVAAYLSLDEDPALSRYLEEKYRLAYRTAQRSSKARLHAITEVV